METFPSRPAFLQINLWFFEESFVMIFIEFLTMQGFGRILRIVTAAARRWRTKLHR